MRNFVLYRKHNCIVCWGSSPESEEWNQTDKELIPISQQCLGDLREESWGECLGRQWSGQLMVRIAVKKSRWIKGSSLIRDNNADPCVTEEDRHKPCVSDSVLWYNFLEHILWAVIQQNLPSMTTSLEWTSAPQKGQGLLWAHIVESKTPLS